MNYCWVLWYTCGHRRAEPDYDGVSLVPNHTLFESTDVGKVTENIQRVSVHFHDRSQQRSQNALRTEHPK